MSGNVVTMADPVTTPKWDRIMEKIDDARTVLRSMWKWPEVWVIVIVCCLVARSIVNAGVAEKLAEYNRTQIESMKQDAADRLVENIQSKADRAILHEEGKTAREDARVAREETKEIKAALKRLEKAVKTGEYP